MPLVIFVILYTTGIMLSFANNSYLWGIRLNGFLRLILFLKKNERLIFIHTLLFQILNAVLITSIVILYYILNENMIVKVYNVYKWTALIMFVVVMGITVIDVVRLEKNGKGRNYEDN